MEIDKSTRQKGKKEKEEINNRSTVNIPKGSKGKIEAKIDCWSNRKTVAPRKTQPPQEHKAPPKLILAQDFEEEQTRKQGEYLTYEKLASKIQERRIREKERSDFSEERLKALREMELHKEEMQQEVRPRKDSFRTGI